MISELLLIANIICCLGTIDLIYGVVKNKKLLHGYSLRGSFLTFLSLLLFFFTFYIMGEYLSVLFGGVTILYWGFVVAFKLKYRDVKA